MCTYIKAKWEQKKRNKTNRKQTLQLSFDLIINVKCLEKMQNVTSNNIKRHIDICVRPVSYQMHWKRENERQMQI